MMAEVDVDNALVLHDLNKESIARELIEKTKSGGISWSSLGNNSFSTNTTGSESKIWTFYLSKTQIGSLSYRYNLDIKKEGETYLTIVDGPFGSSERDSQTKNLYEVVEMITLSLDARAVETLRIIQDIIDCIEI